MARTIRLCEDGVVNAALERFNSLPAGLAEDALYGCFANRRWAKALAGARPFGDVADAIAAAESAWTDIRDVEWLAAFEAHPRIGERGGHAPTVSAREQSRVAQAEPETLTLLAAENREYEKRFGHVFLIAASGRTAAEILETLRRRINNDAATELRVASEEQRKITRLRLKALLT